MSQNRKNKKDQLLADSQTQQIGSISPSFLTEIFDNFAEAVVVTDTDRRIIYVNSATETLFGYCEDQLYGNLADILYADESDFAEQGINHFNASSKVPGENYRVAYCRADGEAFLGLTSGAAMRSAEDLVVGYIGIIRPTRSLEQSLDTLQKIQASFSDASLTDAQKIEALLKVGLKHFGLEIAIHSRINGSEYIVENCFDYDQALKPSTTFDLSGTYCVHTLSADGPVGFHFVGESEIRTHPCYRDFKLESYIGCPIKVNGELFGTINFSGRSPTDPFCQDDYILIQLLADTLSYITYKATSEEKLLTLASTDELTGLPNRRATLERLAEHIKLADRYGRYPTVLLIDIDHFKKVNDEWGHSAGDAALVGFARIASSLGRETDFCGRMGGEEFVIVFPDAGSQAGLNIGNRLRQRLAAEPIELGNGESITLSVSAGLATLKQGESLETLLARADGAMYRAKQDGRDQVCISEPENNRVN